jgi:hypothetical protein
VIERARKRDDPGLSFRARGDRRIFHEIARLSFVKNTSVHSGLFSASIRVNAVIILCVFRSVRLIWTFVIAHRLSTVRRADVLLPMDGGRVIERGTDRELMNARGVYHDMVVRQMESHGKPGEQVLRG